MWWLLEIIDWFLLDIVFELWDWATGRSRRHRTRCGDYTNRAFRVYELPPSFRFPPLREGNLEGRAYSVPPARRGNLKEGVINCCFL